MVAKAATGIDHVAKVSIAHMLDMVFGLQPCRLLPMCCQTLPRLSGDAHQVLAMLLLLSAVQLLPGQMTGLL